MVKITSQAATICSKFAIETPEQHCIKYAEIQAFSDPYFPVYGQNHIRILLYFIYENIFHIFHIFHISVFHMQIRESLYFGIFHVVQDVKYVQS